MTGMPLWLLYLLICLTVYRTTRLVVEDKLPFVAVPRTWLIRWLDPRDEDDNRVGEPPIGGFGRAVGYLMGCEWCTSAWVGAAVITAVDCYTSVPLPGLVWACSSAVAGWLSAAEGWGDMRWRRNRATAWLVEDDCRKRGLKLPKMGD